MPLKPRKRANNKKNSKGARRSRDIPRKITVFERSDLTQMVIDNCGEYIQFNRERGFSLALVKEWEKLFLHNFKHNHPGTFELTNYIEFLVKLTGQSFTFMQKIETKNMETQTESNILALTNKVKYILHHKLPISSTSDDDSLKVVDHVLAEVSKYTATIDNS